jgi:transposase-like protein
VAIPPLVGHLVVEVGMPVVIDEDGSSRRRRGRYPKQFRRDAAALVIDQHRLVADVARELGVVEQTLGNWVRQERIDRVRNPVDHGHRFRMIPDGWAVAVVHQ